MPALTVTSNDFKVIEGYIGEGYAHTTEPAEHAIALVQEKENIGLEHVYTGKCMAALIDAANEATLNDKTIIFWNTYNSLPYQQSLSDVKGELSS